MTYDPRIATISRAEFDELMAIVRTPSTPPLTDEDRWRRDYQAEQQRRRVVGLQQDLFAAKAVIPMAGLRIGEQKAWLAAETLRLRGTSKSVNVQR